MMVLSRIVAVLLISVVCAATGPPFDRLGDMSPGEKSRMRTKRILLGKLNAAAQKAVRCKRCKGRGYIVTKVRVPLPGHTSMLKDRRKKCPLCFGAKLHPWEDLNHKLTAYYRAKREFERDYPFKSPVKTGLEAGVFRSVTTASAWKHLNAYALKRLVSGSREKNEVFLFVVRVESNSRSSDGEDAVIGCLALDPGRPSRGLPVTLYLPRSKRGLPEISAYLVFAWDEGVERYGSSIRVKTFTSMATRHRKRKHEEKQKHPNPLTVMDFKFLKG